MSATNIQIVLFGVSDGSYESLILLEEFMYKYPDLQYCMVGFTNIKSTGYFDVTFIST